MNLNQVIKNLKFKSILGNSNIEISDIIYDSRKVVRNSVFVCLTGANFDGNNFTEQAINNGATVIVTEKDIKIPGICIITVENSREALATMSANFFDHPARKLKTIAITGTKGKTSTSFMIKCILESTGAKVGLIGTIGYILGEKITDLNNTTPESYEVQKYLNNMIENGCKYAVLEASSLGLKNHRLDNIIFDYGIFTNFSNDHISKNEHENLQEYLESKKILFKNCKIGIINTDDNHAQEIISDSTCEIKTYSLKNIKNMKYVVKNNIMGMSFDLASNLNINNIFVSVPGEFNIYNSLASIILCENLGISTENIISGLSKVKVKGRMENIINNNKFQIIIDYAHNYVSMKSLLETVRKYNPKRIVTVFGAGGDRPKSRRYEMGQIASELSDFCIITDDNPRFEDRNSIIQDIVSKITKNNYIIISNRKEAIEYSIKNSQDGDVIILAGKGHETYQEISGVKYEFDERKIVNNILENI
ncbi:MAG: UDP-N-acetylmuramoyl-L-alanyl-D-glutamate--2,6-diaminopimelate ligase [Clostridia bacterium]|nr:UDP-N-acetylmuramoyl-L-alanyl-D-glutamate--2,6-diaminopimelate ligase [Clostridia bacterium]